MSDTPTPMTDEACADLIGDAFMSSRPTHGDWVPVSLSRKLERELAEARIEIGKANVHTAHWQACCSEDTIAQLTAHKAALEKCENALLATWADLDHLNHWMPTPCRELYMEAKLEIAKLKGTNELQGLQEAR